MNDNVLHTPSPWTIGDYTNGCIGVFSEGLAICRVHTFTPPEEKLANARLIAAAPDLLEALQDITRICEAVRFPVGLGKGQLARIEKARAVIAKATGAANV